MKETELQNARVDRLLVERTPEGRYQALVMSPDIPPYLVSSRPGVARTWLYLGPCFRHLQQLFPEVTHFELRLRPLPLH